MSEYRDTGVDDSDQQDDQDDQEQDEGQDAEQDQGSDDEQDAEPDYSFLDVSDDEMAGDTEEDYSFLDAPDDEIETFEDYDYDDQGVDPFAAGEETGELGLEQPGNDGQAGEWREEDQITIYDYPHDPSGNPENLRDDQPRAFIDFNQNPAKEKGAGFITEIHERRITVNPGESLSKKLANALKPDFLRGGGGGIRGGGGKKGGLISEIAGDIYKGIKKLVANLGLKGGKGKEPGLSKAQLQALQAMQPDQEDDYK